MQQHRPAPGQAAAFDIEADAAPAIGQHAMLASVRIGRDGQPAREISDQNAVGIRMPRRRRRDDERTRIERRVPDDPRLGCRALGRLGESRAPIGPRLASPCSREPARRYNRDRAAAIPT
jgi:hypothetical protein